MGLGGKIAIVTAAAGVIGSEIALCLAKHGIVPIIVDIDQTKSKKLVRVIQKKGISASSIRADLSKISEIRKMVKKVVQDFGKIDILINNVGILETLPIESVTEEAWDTIIDVNLKSTFFTSQQALQYMKEVKKGGIINIASVAGRMGSFAGGAFTVHRKLK